MSTNDVPGANVDNHDDLHAGCWAEHADGTLLYVLGTENHKVIFELYDMSDPNSPVEFRDAMPQKEFERKFSWDPLDPTSVKWVWHDKSVFPWHRILDKLKPGVKPVSAERQIEEAERVAAVRKKRTGKGRTPVQKKRAKATILKKVGAPVPQSVARTLARERALKPAEVKHADVVHRVDREMPKSSIGKRIRDRIQGAIDKLSTRKGE